jgi:SAM-dependent methyltransferase
MDNIFTKDFWVTEWARDKESDTYNVHRGFSTPDYWDNAAKSYNENKKEVSNLRIEKTIDFLKRSDLVFDGMKVLEIGCGTGLLAMALAKQGAKVTALDFSKGMLEKFKQDIPPEIEKNITILLEDWHTVDLEKNGWVKQFDLVIAFMSPGVANPEAFFKMMKCSKNGCAIRGWAAKRNHPIITALWKKIMGTELEDKPQSVLYKLNLLFSLGYFPEITFDTIEWEQEITLQEELDRQLSFFRKISDDKSDTQLESIIRPYLESISLKEPESKGLVSEENMIVRQHQGLTATAVWKI